MINNAGGNNGAQIPGQQLAHVSAKEFGSKFKSKRGKCAHPDRHPMLADQARLGVDGGLGWQVTPGLNLFRRESSDLISFLFHVECYTFLASDCDFYLPPYGTSDDLCVVARSMEGPSCSDLT